MKLRAHLIASLGFLIISFLIIPTVIVGQQVKPDKGKSKKFLVDGDKLFREKNYRDAVGKLSESVKFDANNAHAHYLKGYTHYYLKEYDDALTELNLAEQQKFKLIEIQKVRAFVQYERKDYDAAMADTKALLAVEPQNVDYILMAGKIYLAQKNYDEALASFRKLASTSPSNGNIDFELAQIYAAKGDLENQAASAEAAMQKGTQFYADAQILAADAYVKLGKTQQAETALLKVLDSKPESREVYLSLSEIYRQQSRFTDAIEILRRGIRLLPNDGGLYSDISWFYSLAGRNEEAIQAAQAGIRFQPDQYMAYTNLCRAYNDANKPELAISACNNALKLKEGDGETFFYLGRAHDLINKPNDATRYYKQAVTGLEKSTSERPDYSDGYYLLGNAYFADGQLDKAIAAYSKCLQMTPKFARARYNIGIVQLEKKNKSAATEQYNILVGIDRSLATKLKSEIDKVSDKP
ncbi:MAG: tetratricopeptide repeat protein [Pyrinomonadaceae bacterium]